jgi:prepilin-type N-terminal cleavage/methylation domain-containing protein
MKKKYNQNGFTLIELLVVITIIGLLSSLAVVSLNSARIKARDALRKADMAQMRTAVNLYYSDYNKYPICGKIDNSCAGQPNCDYGANVGNNGDISNPVGADGSWCYINTLKNILTQGQRPIIEEMPVDPRNKENVPLIGNNGGDNTYIYRYASDGDQYVFVYTLEESNGQPMQTIRGW